jgi:AraC-like DNA-binding protein
MNVYLAIIFFGASTRLILKGFIELTHNTELFTTLSNHDVFLIGFPLPYLSFRNLVFKKSVFKRIYLIHFILPALLTIEINYHLFEELLRVEFYFLIKSLIISIVVFYSVMCFILLNKSFWRKTTVIELKTENDTILKKWTIVFFTAFMITGLRVIMDQLFLKEKDFLSENFFTWMTWLIVFIMILSTPSILNVYISQISRERGKDTKYYSNWQLKPTYTITNPKDIQLSQKINGELEQYFIRISQFVEENHLFRKSDFTIHELALKSKSPISHLSFIFKYHSDISFNDFRKKERIKDAIALIEEGYLKSNTLESLSKTIGFYTYNSFFIAFKEITGKAPQNYVTTLKE